MFILIRLECPTIPHDFFVVIQWRIWGSDVKCACTNRFIKISTWSGNIFTKGLVFFAHLRSAGTLNGLKTPVVMSSRTDTVENKYLSILAAALQSIQNKRAQ